MDERHALAWDFVVRIDCSVADGAAVFTDLGYVPLTLSTWGFALNANCHALGRNVGAVGDGRNFYGWCGGVAYKNSRPGHVNGWAGVLVPAWSYMHDFIY